MENKNRIPLLAKLGLGLFLLGFILFNVLFFTADYQLSSNELKQALGNETHYQQLKQPLGNILGKEYASSFSFVSDYNSAFKSYNDSLKQAEAWDKVIYNDYTFQVTKAASSGLPGGSKSMWLFLTLGLAILGGLIYGIKQFSEGPEGIKNNHIFHSALLSRGWLGVILGTYLILFYIVLYFFPEYIVNAVSLVDPLSKALSGSAASQWFLYGTLYTIAVFVMGVRMFVKYRGNRYQQIRTISVMFFQTSFAFLIPEILVAFNQPWFDFKNIWPLDYDFFYSYNINNLISSGGLGIFMLVWGIGLAVIAVPVITYFYGKRWYCSWVCGCGGLAETMGDPFRQLSDKSLKAWKVERWMVHGVLVFVTVMTAITLANYFSNYGILGDATNSLHKAYGFMIGSVFSGVVGTGFYPLMGNRVWCRFGCPLAAYLGLVQRFKSRFRITTNGGQCISCGNCSTYCEMGIDVKWYAQRGQNIVRSSCVGCGICSAVCPRGVLKLENKKDTGASRTEHSPITLGNDGVKVNL